MPPLAPKIPYRTGVYCLRNTVNGKRYVGSSAKCIQGRVRSHKNDLRRNVHGNRYLQNAWNKYGEDAFVSETLSRCAPEACVRLEQYWIDRYSSANSLYGYNILPVAGSSLGLKMSPESVARVTAANKKAKADPAVRKRLADATKRNWDDPVKRARMVKANQDRVTDEFRKKRSEQMKNWLSDPVNRKLLGQRVRQAHVNDPTLREKMAERVRGKKHSPETLEKMRASQSARRARERQTDGNR